MSNILSLSVGVAGCGTMGLPMLEVLIKNINAYGYDIKPELISLQLKISSLNLKKNFLLKVMSSSVW